MGIEGVSYHIKLIVTLNQISGNPYIWAQPRGRRQLPNHIKYCVLFLYCIYLVYALHTQRPTREFRLIALKFELQHSPILKSCVQEQLIFVNYYIKKIHKNTYSLKFLIILFSNSIKSHKMAYISCCRLLKLKENLRICINC